jgi:hypothetical protein
LRERLACIAAGRTAGYLLARFAGKPTGRLALIADSRSYRAHGERELGFLSIIEEMFPSMHPSTGCCNKSGPSGLAEGFHTYNPGQGHRADLRLR